jgi:hypothetical protein
MSPRFDIYGSYMMFGHRIRGGVAFEGEPTKIAVTSPKQ